jgi:hypothetical protein
MPAHPHRALPLVEALNASEPLLRLAQRLRESKQRFECVRPALPVPWANQVCPGPIDGLGWTLLADNAAVAAKLRQLVPAIDALLAQHNYSPIPLRVKVRRP